MNSAFKIAVSSTLLALAFVANAKNFGEHRMQPSLMPSCNDNPYPPIDYFSVSKDNSINRTISHHNLPQGSNSAEIAANFAKIIEDNLQNGASEHIISRLSDKELNDLADQYDVLTNKNTAHLLAILAARLSDRSLLRIASAFGSARVATAVQEYSPADIRRSFEAEVALIPQRATLPSTFEPMSGPAPTADMTMREIYLEFRTAPVG